MIIISRWHSMTTEQQLEWLQADVITASREQIGSNAAWFLDYHGLDHLTATAWEIANYERVTEGYINKRNADRETPITLNSIVYGSAMDAIRREADRDRKHQHESMDKAEGMSAKHRRNTERATEDRVSIRLWLDELLNGLDETDAQIVKGRLNGMQQNEIAQIVGVSPAYICKRLKKIRAAVTAGV